MRLRSAASVNDSKIHAVIAVVGGAIMDMVFETERMPDLDESLDASSLAYKPGGKGSNTAVAIYRAQHPNPDGPADNITTRKPNPTNSNGGRENDALTNGNIAKKVEVSVYLNTTVGDDNFGRDLKKSLERNGVLTSGIRSSSKEPTGTCAVFVEKFTGLSRDIGYPGANTNWTPRYQDSVECLADGHRPDLIVCHLENQRETIERILETAGRADVETLLNPSPVTYLLSTTYKHVTHLVLNEREAAQLAMGDEKGALETQSAWEEACEFFIEHGVKHVVITLGDKGAFWASEGKRGLVPAVKNVKIKDTTGAG